jgi:hypothetical protein
MYLHYSTRTELWANIPPPHAASRSSLTSHSPECLEEALSEVSHNRLWQDRLC